MKKILILTVTMVIIQFWLLNQEIIFSHKLNEIDQRVVFLAEENQSLLAQIALKSSYQAIADK